MDKLTSQLQTALSDAQSMALGHDNAYIEPLHLMKVLLEQEGSSSGRILTKANVNVAALRAQLDAALNRLPQVEGTGGEVHVSPELNRILNLMDKLAQKRKDDYISSELFLLAAVEDSGTLGDLLRKLGASPQALEKAIQEERGGQRVNDPHAEEQRRALEKYGSLKISVGRFWHRELPKLVI
jgi:ATP-dependent Clp protease ATP-binding subunit ClpB